MTPSTKKRGTTDTATIFEYLESHDPFEDSDYLFDISTGIASGDSNAYMAEEVGRSIIANTLR